MWRPVIETRRNWPTSGGPPPIQEEEIDPLDHQYTVSLLEVELGLDKKCFKVSSLFLDDIWQCTLQKSLDMYLYHVTFLSD